MFIGQEQFDQLRMQSRTSFVRAMVEHAFAFQPQLCRTVGREAMLPIVDGWVLQSVAQGFDKEGQVQLMVELGLLFGSGFRDDPQLPWLQSVWSDPSLVYPRHKADALHRRCNVYLNEVYGPDNAHVLSALQALVSTEGRMARFESGDLDSGLVETLHALHPQKLVCVGQPAMRALIASARAQALRHGMSSPRATGLLLILMSAFGHRCTSDPLYPWIGRTLARDGVAQGEAGAVRLEQRARVWLRHVIENHPSLGGVEN